MGLADYQKDSAAIRQLSKTLKARIEFTESVATDGSLMVSSAYSLAYEGKGLVIRMNMITEKKDFDGRTPGAVVDDLRQELTERMVRAMIFGE